MSIATMRMEEVVTYARLGVNILSLLIWPYLCFSKEGWVQKDGFYLAGCYSWKAGLRQVSVGGAPVFSLFSTEQGGEVKTVTETPDGPEKRVVVKESVWKSFAEASAYEFSDFTARICNTEILMPQAVQFCDPWSNLYLASVIMLLGVGFVCIVLIFGSIVDYYHHFMVARKQTRQLLKVLYSMGPTFLYMIWMIYTFAAMQLSSSFPANSGLPLGSKWGAATILMVLSWVPITLVLWHPKPTLDELVHEEKAAYRKHDKLRILEQYATEESDVYTAALEQMQQMQQMEQMQQMQQMQHMQQMQYGTMGPEVPMATTGFQSW